jgi:hypothetical protein
MNDKVDRLAAFLSKNVEGYLFKDLETLKDAEPSTKPGDGFVGYPMLMTACAGIELFGALSSPNTFQARGKSAEYFANWWENYLYPNDPEKSAGPCLYRLVRCGLMHGFLTKGDILVVKDRRELHLKLKDPGPAPPPGRAQVYIDPVKLAEDLVTSFGLIKSDVDARRPKAASMADRFDEMVIACDSAANKDDVLLSQLPIAATTASSPVPSGPPFFPTPAKSN